MSSNWENPELARILASLVTVAEQLNSDDDETEQARFEAEIARKNRSGERGRDWMTLQGRIDLGQTTLAEVMSGADSSPEAQRVTQLSRKNLAALQKQMAEDAAEKDDALDPMAENEVILAEMHQRIQEIKSRFRIG